MAVPPEIVDAEVGWTLSAEGREALVGDLVEAFRDLARDPGAWKAKGRQGRLRAEKELWMGRASMPCRSIGNSREERQQMPEHQQENHATTVRDSLSANVLASAVARVGYLITRFFIPPFVLANVSLEAYGLWATAFIVVSYMGFQRWDSRTCTSNTSRSTRRSAISIKPTHFCPPDYA